MFVFHQRTRCPAGWLGFRLTTIREGDVTERVTDWSKGRVIGMVIHREEWSHYWITHWWFYSKFYGCLWRRRGSMRMFAFTWLDGDNLIGLGDIEGRTRYGWDFGGSIWRCCVTPETGFISLVYFRMAILILRIRNCGIAGTASYCLNCEQLGIYWARLAR